MAVGDIKVPDCHIRPLAVGFSTTANPDATIVSRVAGLIKNKSIDPSAGTLAIRLAQAMTMNTAVFTASVGWRLWLQRLLPFPAGFWGFTMCLHRWLLPKHNGVWNFPVEKYPAYECTTEYIKEALDRLARDPRLGEAQQVDIFNRRNFFRDAPAVRLIAGPDNNQA